MTAKVSDATSQVFVLSRDPKVQKAAGSLEQRGCAITYAPKPLGAARAARGCDVAVIDLDRGGYSVAKDIKASTPDTKVVMLCDRSHDRWLCMQAGADIVFIKPLQDLPDFVEQIQALALS